jgi:hypothetical protein
VRAAADVVEEQPRRAIVVAHHHIRVAIVIDIAERRAAADFRELEHGARPRGGVLELPAAKIAQQLFPLMQWKPVVRLRERLDLLNGAVDRQDVQPPIVVDVDPGCAEARV